MVATKVPDVDPRLAAELVRAARRLGHNPADADDLAQECMLAYSKGDFQGRSSLRTWLYRVLWNKHVDLLRSRRSPPLRIETASGPELGKDDMKGLVREALDRLPDLQRAVLVLRYFEGLPYGELAEVLDRPEGTLHADCFRALEALYEILARKHGIEKVKEWL